MEDDSEQQLINETNDDPLPLGSPPPVDSTAALLNTSRQILQNRTTTLDDNISVVSARSYQNLSLNSSRTNESLKSLNSGIIAPPPYSESPKHTVLSLNTAPNPSAGLGRMLDLGVSDSENHIYDHQTHQNDLQNVQNVQNDRNGQNAQNDQNYQNAQNGQNHQNGQNRQNRPRKQARRSNEPAQDRFIHCKVCHAFINVKNKLHQSVVRCSHCREATAIRPAPGGKQYVRCPCDCLLICKSNSSRIMCPRPNCNRTITIVQKKKEEVENDRTSSNNGNIGSGVNSGVNSGNNGINGNNGKNEKNGKNGKNSPKSRAGQIFEEENQLLHSPYSARRNPAFGSTSSINTAEIGHAEIRTTARDSPNLIRGGPSQNTTRLVRLQCAYCHMEFVRMTPLTNYGTCPHCETSMPFGNDYKHTRVWIFSLLAFAILATSLALQLTGVLSKDGSHSTPFNLMFIGLYVLSGIFGIASIKYACMRVTHISESEL